jgi:hypothetical protein
MNQFSATMFFSLASRSNIEAAAYDDVTSKTIFSEELKNINRIVWNSKFGSINCLQKSKKPNSKKKNCNFQPLGYNVMIV